MKMTAQEYARRVRRVGPHSPLGTDCLWAFCVGGGICLLGEILRQRYLAMGMEADLAGTLTSCTLIALSAVLTTLGWYQKLAAKAGAGSLVPITGFANAVVSAAIEFKAEGRVLGTGAKMFTIAGPVIVYGTLAAVVYGAVLWVLDTLGMSSSPERGSWQSRQALTERVHADPTRSVFFAGKEKFCLCRSGAGTPCCSRRRRSLLQGRQWAAKRRAKARWRQSSTS